MKNHSIALMIYGEPGSGRNALTEEKYSKLAAYFAEQNFNVKSVCYHDSIAEILENELANYAATLVWVNPIEQQSDRTRLDALLKRLAAEGCFVSAHPDAILKIGTKEILYKIKDEVFGMDVKLYHSYEDFRERFLKFLNGDRFRILKQYRGNGGKGVFKIDVDKINNNIITVTHAIQGDQETSMSIEEFFASMESYFRTGNMLIDQQWNPNILNGMVRCYLTGNKVTGFGYQEVNALYPKINSVFKKPGKRFYFTEDCGLFADLKKNMEMSWISRIQEITQISSNHLPVIWDADFFINNINTERAGEKYSLCEINVSSVSPFPESSIPYIVEEVKTKINIHTSYHNS